MVKGTEFQSRLPASSLPTEILKIMATEGGRISFLQECGQLWVSYAQVDGPTHLHKQAILIGFSGLLQINNGYEVGRVTFLGVPGIVRGRIRVDMMKIHCIHVRKL